MDILYYTTVLNKLVLLIIERGRPTEKKTIVVHQLRCTAIGSTNAYPLRNSEEEERVLRDVLEHVTWEYTTTERLHYTTTFNNILLAPLLFYRNG